MVIDCNIARYECIVAVASKRVLTRGTRRKHKGGTLHLSKRHQRCDHGSIGDLHSLCRTEIDVESIRRNAGSSGLVLDTTFSQVLHIRVLLRNSERQRRRR